MKSAFTLIELVVVIAIIAILASLAGQVGPDLTPISGEGYVIAANGDEVFVEVNPDGSVAVTGGTGRFEGATGSLTGTVVGDPVVTYDPATGTLTIDSAQLAEGTLTY